MVKLDDNEQIFFDIMFKHYNNGVEVEKENLQEFIDKMIKEGVNGDEEIEREIIEEEFISLYRPKTRSIYLKKRLFSTLRLYFGPKFKDA